MTIPTLLSITFFIWSVELIIKQVIDMFTGVGSSCRPYDFQPLVRRIKAYTALKPCPVCSDAQDAGAALTGAEHEVLLGILKKVEAKNAVLATFWSIAVAVVVAIGVSVDFKEAAMKYEFFCLFAVLVPFLISIVVAAKQLDQISTNRILARHSDEQAIRREMQEALMKDLLDKEAAFRFGWYGAAATSLLSIVGSISAVLYFL